ncbi:hypothetical protein TNIN_407591 [Trichonephila inaurata madagascariensis]|uniref:Uncharacterized protein n=1 Tax=Trichonephila inaurata madagascariensis TaxID=2747483 RepID=A0A8X6XIP3_9ARAC|nr:hypothetical protein TNIN_407591 [Trichonephila inaurata madagascariensis]
MVSDANKEDVTLRFKRYQGKNCIKTCTHSETVLLSVILEELRRAMCIFWQTNAHQYERHKYETNLPKTNHKAENFQISLLSPLFQITSDRRHPPAFSSQPERVMVTILFPWKPDAEDAIDNCVPFAIPSTGIQDEFR